MALSPSATIDLLRKLDHFPNKKLGQNFLIDGNLVEKSISMAALPLGLPVLEIGPGLGTLTERLLRLGHQVYAVEIDRRLEAHLRERLGSFIESGQLDLLRADAVKSPTGNLPETSPRHLFTGLFSVCRHPCRTWPVLSSSPGSGLRFASHGQVNPAFCLFQKCPPSDSSNFHPASQTVGQPDQKRTGRVGRCSA